MYKHLVLVTSLEKLRVLLDFIKGGNNFDLNCESLPSFRVANASLNDLNVVESCDRISY